MRVEPSLQRADGQYCCSPARGDCDTGGIESELDQGGAGRHGGHGNGGRVTHGGAFGGRDDAVRARRRRRRVGARCADRSAGGTECHRGGPRDAVRPLSARRELPTVTWRDTHRATRGHAETGQHRRAGVRRAAFDRDRQRAGLLIQLHVDARAAAAGTDDFAGTGDQRDRWIDRRKGCIGGRDVDAGPGHGIDRHGAAFTDLKGKRTRRNRQVHLHGIETQQVPGLTVAVAGRGDGHQAFADNRNATRVVDPGNVRGR